MIGMNHRLSLALESRFRQLIFKLVKLYLSSPWLTRPWSNRLSWKKKNATYRLVPIFSQTRILGVSRITGSCEKIVEPCSGFVPTDQSYTQSEKYRVPLGFVSLGTPIGCSPCSSEKFINLLHFFFITMVRLWGWGGEGVNQTLSPCPMCPRAGASKYSQL